VVTAVTALLVAGCHRAPAGPPARSPEQLVALTSWDEQTLTNYLEILDVATGDVRYGGPADSYRAASWAPDGGRLAVSVPRDGCLECTDIALVSRTGDEIRRLTHGPGNDGFPVWSPDGRRIAFVHTEDVYDGPSRIELIEADGTARRRLTTTLSGLLTWSPDGATLLVEDGLRGVWLVPAAGGPARQLLPTSFAGYRDRPQLQLRNDADATWAPDGRHVVFTRDTGTLERHRWNLYSVDTTTRRLTRLTSDGLEPFAPAFSPDGSQLAFTSSREVSLLCEANAIFVIPARGGPARRISAWVTPGGVGPPHWSADGASVYFVGPAPHTDCLSTDVGGELYSADAATGRTHVVPTTFGPSGLEGVEPRPTSRD
jgi:Tol biopolymer transport system component